MLTDGGTKPAVDNRFIRGLSAGREALFVLAADQWNDAFFVFVNPLHARQAPENYLPCVLLRAPILTM